MKRFRDKLRVVFVMHEWCARHGVKFSSSSLMYEYRQSVCSDFAPISVIAQGLLIEPLHRKQSFGNFRSAAISQV